MDGDRIDRGRYLLRKKRCVSIEHTIYAILPHFIFPAKLKIQRIRMRNCSRNKTAVDTNSTWGISGNPVAFRKRAYDVLTGSWTTVEGLTRLPNVAHEKRRFGRNWNWYSVAGEIELEFLNAKSIFRWSFGVLLYEIYSLGREPYESLAVANIRAHLESGHRLPKPAYATDAMSEIRISRVNNL